MVRINCAYSLSDIAAMVGTPLPVSHDAFEPEPPTKRLTDADLARVVATMNDPHATNDDDVAVVTVAPQIPAGTPSPLGDDGPLASEREGETAMLPRADVAHDLEEAFSLLVKHGEAAAAADVTHESEALDETRIERRPARRRATSALAGRRPGRAADR